MADLTTRDWPTAFRFSPADPRFCYATHQPTTPKESNGIGRLIVAIHGSGRNAMAYRDGFVETAERLGAFVLAPLFPVSPFDDGNGDGYKYLRERDLRYDEILLRMVADLEQRCGLSFPRFALFGFSGGGHFAHRFLYLHPDRLSTACIGAPGRVTLPDASIPWPDGLGGVEQALGAAPDFKAIGKVRIGMFVGAEDTVPFGSDQPAPHRVGRLERLRDGFRDRGLDPHFELVPQAAHDAAKVIPAVARFLLTTLDPEAAQAAG